MYCLNADMAEPIRVHFFGRNGIEKNLAGRTIMTRTFWRIRAKASLYDERVASC